MTSPPKLTQGVDLEGFEALNPGKQAQVETLLLPSQAEQLLQEINTQRLELQARIDGLVAELAKPDKVKSLESELEAELEAIRVQSLEPASSARRPLRGSVREREEAAEVARREQRQRSLRRMQLDRADAEELLREQARLGALERASIEAVKLELEGRIAQQELLEARITQRSSMLRALQAQPDWFNYVAAFAGSCVSTMAMHPLDTLKTRAVASAAQGGRPGGGGGDGGGEGSGGEGSGGGTVQRVARTTMSASAQATSALSESPAATGGVLDAASMLGADVLEAEAATSQEARPSPGPAPAAPAPAAQAAQAVARQAAEEEAEAAGSAVGAERAAGAEPEPEPEHEGWSLEGYLSLYQGIDGALVKEGPPSALYLGIYEVMKSHLLATTSWPLLAIYLMAGALGECAGSIVRAPAEAIKSRVQSGIDPSTRVSVQRVLGTREGRANVMRAWSASLWRDVPFGAIQLAVFEGLKSYIINSPQTFNDLDVDTLLSEALLGAAGGAVGAFLTVPLDVITIRILTQGTGEQACDEDECTVPNGVLGMARQILDEGGAAALFTGWRARTVYWAPAIGIFLSCYCTFRQQAIVQGFFPA